MRFEFADVPEDIDRGRQIMVFHEHSATQQIAANMVGSQAERLIEFVLCLLSRPQSQICLRPQHEQLRILRQFRNPVQCFCVLAEFNQADHEFPDNLRLPFSAIQFEGQAVMVRGALILLGVFALPMLLIAAAIRCESKGPALYRQRRRGFNNRVITILKFRTMRHQPAARWRPARCNDPRITRIGRLIRMMSLDELPNLINVLRGQMSLVGPRPPTPDEVALYEPWHMQRLQILPGLTGLWQVNGRSDVPFDEMCLLDIYYIENWSVRLDAQILFMTLPRVLLRHGAY